jgi:hypothetical protein
MSRQRFQQWEQNAVRQGPTDAGLNTQLNPSIESHQESRKESNQQSENQQAGHHAMKGHPRDFSFQVVLKQVCVRIELKEEQLNIHENHKEGEK